MDTLLRFSTRRSSSSSPRIASDLARYHSMVQIRAHGHRNFHQTGIWYSPGRPPIKSHEWRTLSNPGAVTMVHRSIASFPFVISSVTYAGVTDKFIYYNENTNSQASYMQLLARLDQIARELSSTGIDGIIPFSNDAKLYRPNTPCPE
jgi:hypothetical protein